MKQRGTGGKSRKVHLPRKGANDAELAAFFDQTDATDLISAGTIEADEDHRDIERALGQYWRQPNTKQLNIRIPAAAKSLIERLARRKTIEVSTLVRMWVIESMRREARR